MKIGYPCINSGIGCTTNRTFRLSSYSEERLQETVRQNLSCLRKILEFNFRNNLLFFRISSSIIPFASHPVCTFDWQKYFRKQFQDIGEYMKKHEFRISMHPDQFVLINALKADIVQKSIKELEYHCDLLDLLDLAGTARVQIHVGGVYGDKNNSMIRFIENYKQLPAKIKKRLVIENDHVSFSLKDCLLIHEQTGIPVVFDTFHHECLNNGERTRDAVIQASKTWQQKDGELIIDYSSQKPDAKKGSHTESIDIKKFADFLRQTNNLDFDIMLEIKDKEKSALKAVKLISTQG